MYETAGTLPTETIPDGTSLLCFGPPMSGKEELLIRFLTAGLERDEGVVVVSTDVGAADLFARYPELDDDAVQVIDCAGESEPSRKERVRTVSSPADLTGVGIELSEAVAALHAAGHDRVRVGVDSISTLGVYSEQKRLLRFLHALTNRVDAANAVGMFLAHGGTFSDERLEVLLPLFDGRVDVRTADDGTTELRVRGIPDASDEWVRYEAAAGLAATGTTARADELTVSPDVPASLASLLESVSEQRLTLTLCNAEDENVRADLAEAFERLNTDVVTASLDAPAPADFAVLHRDGDFLAAEPIRTVHEAVTLSGDEEDLFETVRLSSVFAEANRVTFGIDSARRVELGRISRLFELAAWRTGTGSLHAGFQRFSRLEREPETAEIYRALVDAGVDVHIYGRGDVTVDLGDVTVHEETAEEIGNHWFVVYDGGGDPDEMGAVLAREEHDGTFRGFWTYQPELAAGLLEYLRERYGQARMV